MYKTLESLQDDQVKNQKITFFNKPITIVESKVESYMTKCYQKIDPSVTVAPGSSLKGVSTYYYKKPINDGTIFYVTIADEYYLMAIEITSSNSQKTKFNMYANGTIAMNAFDNIEKYINGEELSCHY